MSCGCGCSRQEQASWPSVSAFCITVQKGLRHAAYQERFSQHMFGCSRAQCSGEGPLGQEATAAGVSSPIHGPILWPPCPQRPQAPNPEDPAPTQNPWGMNHIRNTAGLGVLHPRARTDTRRCKHMRTSLPTPTLLWPQAPSASVFWLPQQGPTGLETFRALHPAP